MENSKISGIFDRLETKQLNCDQHGVFEATRYKGRDDWTDCPVCTTARDAAALIAAQAVAAAERRAITLQNRLGRACIPLRFQGKSFESYVADTPGKQHALKTCHEFADNFYPRSNAQPSLILSGKPGTGKTHLACAVARQIIASGYVAVFARAYDAVRTIKSTWSKGSVKTELEAINIFVEPDLLILDEVGLQFGTDTEMLLIFEIINGRYEAMRPTILLSNLAINELKNFLGERVIDRLREDGGKHVALDWDSHRSKI